MNTPSDEVEVVNEDENGDVSPSNPTTKDQNSRKRKGNDNDPYAKCKYSDVLCTSSSKRIGVKKYEENLILESEDEEEEEVGENSKSLGSSLTRGVFDAKIARVLIAKMIIIDKLPLKFVEEEGFRRFMEQTMCEYAPKFEIPSLPTISKDILEIYKEEKQSLRNIFAEQGPRVSLTIDTWTSDEDMKYMVLTAHFIDVDWKMHKKILNFRQIENHGGEIIGREVEQYLKQWGIEKILTLTVDNASSNDTTIAYLVNCFKNELVLEGKFVDVRCCAYIFTLIACDVLKDFQEVISKIRNAVRFVRSSPVRYSSFEKCIKEENLSSNSILCLDVPTRWDSTYMMLKEAKKFAKAFEKLGIHDTTYLNRDVPSSRDWEVVRSLVHGLSVFYKASSRLSGSLHVPSSRIFHEISTLQNFIKIRSSRSDNLVLNDIAKKVQVKYEKYWGNSEKTNYFLYVATLLDPRCKMKFLQYWFTDFFGANEAKEMCKKVEDVLRQLYNEYSLSIVNNESSTPIMAHNSNTRESSPNASECYFKNFMDEWKKELENEEPVSEIDIYLLEPLVKREENFDILEWWKNNCSRYKILGKIAREILAIPVSTVASEYAFSYSERVIDSVCFMSTPNLVEVLVCLQNWLKKDAKSIDLQKHLEDIARMEEDFETSLKEASTMEVGTMLHEKDD